MLNIEFGKKVKVMDIVALKKTIYHVLVTVDVLRSLSVIKYLTHMNLYMCTLT